jgi:hypothetical protein
MGFIGRLTGYDWEGIWQRMEAAKEATGQVIDTAPVVDGSPDINQLPDAALREIIRQQKIVAKEAAAAEGLFTRHRGHKEAAGMREEIEEAEQIVAGCEVMLAERLAAAPPPVYSYPAQGYAPPPPGYGYQQPPPGYQQPPPPAPAPSATDPDDDWG